MSFRRGSISAELFSRSPFIWNWTRFNFILPITLFPNRPFVKLSIELEKREEEKSGTIKFYALIFCQQNSQWHRVYFSIAIYWTNWCAIRWSLIWILLRPKFQLLNVIERLSLFCRQLNYHGCVDPKVESRLIYWPALHWPCWATPYHFRPVSMLKWQPERKKAPHRKIESLL